MANITVGDRNIELSYDFYWVQGFMCNGYNRANGDGRITKAYVKATGIGKDATNVLIGTFYGTLHDLSTRDYVNIGTVPASTEVCAVVSLSVMTDDYLGTTASSGRLWSHKWATYPPCCTWQTWTTGLFGTTHFDAGGQTNGWQLWLYGEGETTVTKTIGIKIGDLFVNKISVLDSTGWQNGRIN